MNERMKIINLRTASKNGKDRQTENESTGPGKD